MWMKLQKQIEVEFEQLNHLIETHRPLLIKCTTEIPNAIEISALAAMLHSFYTGIENVFKRISIELDQTLPGGEFWHRDLLNSMTRTSEKHGPVISETLCGQLMEYLQFRHVFRQAYAFQLRWEKMSHLVHSSEQTLRQLETELNTFLQIGK